MPAVFPNISTGDVCLYPVTQTLAMPTRVIRFLDDTEQRWRSADPLNSWVLTYNRILWADIVTLQNFFNTVKGAFDSTWTFPFLGTNYTSMCFDQDDFSAVESDPGRYTVSLKLRQTAKSGSYSIGGTVTWPVFPGTSVTFTQLPFTSKPAFLTTRNDLPTGARYAWAERSSVLGAWICDYSVITISELGTLLNAFIALAGKYNSFSFTDPNDNSVHAHCRLDTDTFQAKYLGAGQCAVTVPIQEFAG